MVKNMICLSYKYIWVVIFARISHGQVGRSTEGIGKLVKRKPFSRNGNVNSLDVHVEI